ncbi:MAG: ribosomal protein [Gemmatimonadetes bacterium]|nr:ribosomal protein [Gemmatimonadota bacterium]
MKTDIHPEYAVATVKCGCGNTFQTRSTVSEIHTDVCAQCHPFYTGKQRLVDTAGRIDRFRTKYGTGAGTPAGVTTAVAETEA